MEKNKKIYLFLFACLVLPSIITRFGIYTGGLSVTEEFAVLLTLISKFGFIILTVWYATKVKIKPLLSWILGFSTLLPFMPWISLIILLRESKKELKDKLQPTEDEKEVQNPEEEHINKQFIMNKDTWIILTILIAVILGSFYWFSYRPAQIKKECANKHLQSSIMSPADENQYNQCLKKSGL